jgi:hypothetical protein
VEELIALAEAEDVDAAIAPGGGSQGVVDADETSQISATNPTRRRNTYNLPPKDFQLYEPEPLPVQTQAALSVPITNAATLPHP